MSKILVYILDKFVWMLLITALTTQVLQIVGIMEPTKGLEEITCAHDDESNYQMSTIADVRAKRQAEEMSHVLENILNKQFGQGDYFFRMDLTKVITAKI